MGKRRFDSAAARHPAPAIIDNLNWGATLNDKPPADSVTEMAFSSDNLLSVSGWDNAVRIYKVEQNGQSQFRHAFKHGMPVLGCDFSKDGAKVASAGADRNVKVCDLASQQEIVIGTHDKSVRSVRFIDMHNESMLVSGSWDNTIKYWDLRQRRCAATIDCKARVFTMDARQHLLVVGTADRCINVLNLNNLTQIFQKFESALKHQTKVVRLFPDLTGFAVGSIEGRCAIQHFEQKDSHANFSFKCHRVPVAKDTVDVYGINDISFYPNLEYGTFSTAGSDGGICFWDKNAKRCLRKYIDVGDYITATKFNETGSIFAYATGYDWSKGHLYNTSAHPTRVMLHTIKDE